jgi:hypothetical protein
MENEPSRLGITSSSQAYERMVIEFVENLADEVQPNPSFVRYLIIGYFARVLENLDESYGIFFP